GWFFLFQSTVSRNHGRNGGGILVGGQRMFLLENVTISSNSAEERGGGLFINFGLSGAGAHPATYATNAFHNGPGAGAGGNIFVGSPPGAMRLSVTSTIVAKATDGGNCAGQPLSSVNFNLDSENSCGFTQPGDLRNTDPKLGSLRLFNSRTEVHPLP